MDAAFALQQFSQRAEQDSRMLFGILQAAQAHARGLALWVVFVILYPLFLLLAQFAPFVIRRSLANIEPFLPDINDPAALAWIKDAFELYYFSLRGYAPYCLFRGTLRVVLDDLDEHIDGLTFALEQRASLAPTLDVIEQS